MAPVLPPPDGPNGIKWPEKIKSRDDGSLGDLAGEISEVFNQMSQDVDSILFMHPFLAEDIKDALEKGEMRLQQKLTP